MMTTTTLLALLLTGPAAAADAPGPARAVEVVTWNAWGLPSPIARGRKDRLPRIATWLEERGADVAGLQEVWQGARGLLALVAPHLPASESRDSGLALVTTHPVRDLQLHGYTASRGVDSWKGKGLLDAEVDIDGSPIRVAITHLQAGGSARNAGVRAAQVDELLAHLEDAEQPVLLMGDFNLYDDQPADQRTRERLEAAGFVDVAQQMGEVGGTYPGVRHRFDRIYTRSGSDASMVPARASILDEVAPLSDHLPVAATVALTPSEG